MADFVADIVVDLDAISTLAEQANAFLAQSGVDPRAAHHVALVIDELLSNVASHGGAARTPASVRLTVWPDRVQAQVTDYGAKFDPRTAPNIDESAAVGDRRIGGVGVLPTHPGRGGLGYVGERDPERPALWIPQGPGGGGGRGR